MNFKNWLNENSQNIKFASFWSDGEITVYINNQKYIFLTDPVLHERWKRMIKYQPFNVLNEIKTLVKTGKAKQLEPDPNIPVILPKSAQKSFNFS